MIKNGLKEWWIQIANSSERGGWVQAMRWSHDDFWGDGNFANLCAD